MSVTVRTGSALKGLLGGRTKVEASGSTVGELLDHLGVRERVCDDTGKVRRHFTIHINEGEDVRLLQGLDTPVADGDTVTVLSAIAGGGHVSRKVWLTFPRDLVDQPLIWEIGRRFEVVTNIRQASVSREVGIVGLELSGDEDQVDRAVRHLVDKGVSVEPVEMDVVE
jgi:molybdopterin converting factor small subunit